MSKNIRTQVGKIVGKSLNDYYEKYKSLIDNLKEKEEYQSRIISCMQSEVEDYSVKVREEVVVIPFKKSIYEQQQEVETNVLDIENNIIPYLMDMEFNLMLMEDK